MGKGQRRKREKDEEKKEREENANCVTRKMVKRGCTVGEVLGQPQNLKEGKKSIEKCSQDSFWVQQRRR